MTKAKATTKDSSVSQISFTEEEHETLIKFLNMIANHAAFNNMDLKKSHELAQLNIKVINLSRKIEDHIFEIKKVTDKGAK